MAVKDLNFSYLNDLYGNLLTKKQSEAIAYYYNFDMSLSEIAEITKVSRQAVHDCLKTAEIQLIKMDNELNLSEENAANKEKGASIEDAILSLENCINFFVSLVDKKASDNTDKKDSDNTKNCCNAEKLKELKLAALGLKKQIREIKEDKKS